MQQPGEREPPPFLRMAVLGVIAHQGKHPFHLGIWQFIDQMVQFIAHGTHTNEV